MDIKVRLLLGVVVVGAAVSGFALWSHSGHNHGRILLYGNVDIREVDLAFRQP